MRKLILLALVILLVAGVTLSAQQLTLYGSA